MAIPPQKTGRGEPDTGLGLLLMLLPAAMLLVLLLRKVWDSDIFWQLKIGELILDRGGPVPGEPFAALHLGEPLPAVAWAGQAAMAAARRVGGWDLLRVFDAACWLGGFWAVAMACRLRGASLPAVSMALGLTFLAALPTASVRPQSFGCLCFGLLLALQRLGLRPLVTVGLGAPLLVAWQNLHPSVSVAVVAMSLIAFVGWVGWWRGQGKVPIAATVLALVGVLAIFATPDGISIIAISAANARASIAMGVSEWLPLWDSINRFNAVPGIVVALLAVWLMIRNQRIEWLDLAPAIGLALLTLTAYRFVLFWAVAMVPVIAGAAGCSAPRPGRWEAVIVLGSLLLVAVIAPLSAPTRFAQSLPVKALQQMRAYHLHGTIYGDFRFGGVIIDAGYPDWRVAYDGRFYRYTNEEWLYNNRIESGILRLGDVQRRWHPAAFLLDIRRNSSLVRQLASSGTWRCIYAQDGIVAYVPAMRFSPRP
jgi:hypothetical protein